MSESNPSEARPTFGLVVLLGALSAFSPLAIDMYLPGFPEIERDLHAAPGALELTLSVFLAGLAIGQLVCGPLSDRWGRKPTLLLGCVGFALSAALCAVVRSVEELIVLRFLMGFSGAAGLVVARAIVRDRFNETDSSRMYSMMMLVTGIAPIVAPSLGGQLLWLGGWRSVFWTLTLCGAACALAVAAGLSESLPPTRRHRHTARALFRIYGDLLRDRRFMSYTLAIGCASALLFSYITSAPFLFRTLHGVDAQTFGLLFAGNAVGLFGAAQVNRRLLRYRSPEAILRAASLLNAAAGLGLLAATLAQFGGLPLLWGSLFLCLATLGFIFPNATAAAMAPHAQHAGTASALLGAFQYTLGATAGAAVGLWHEGTALPAAALIALCALCGAVTTWRRAAE
ncbi:MAG TPA: Bcr/CflA family multidrug efflux MFS transporter [Pirellulales bacterium]